MLLVLCMCPSWSWAQGKSSGPSRKPPSGSRVTEKERREERARELFANAANAQNNGAFDSAIKLWTKMIEEFNNHPLTSSAQHYLGVCYQEKSPPEYDKAISAFRSALQDPKLKEHEETLVQLGWSLFQTAASIEPPDSAKLSECSKVFALFLDKYPDSPLADKAMFYAGEAEARLGNQERAIGFYNSLLRNRTLDRSPLRPDAMFALGVAYEAAGQKKLGVESYEEFISAFPAHALATSARLRMAELALESEQVDQAVALFESIVDSPDSLKSSMADYILSRYAFTLGKAGQYGKSSDVYRKLSERFPQSPYSTNAALAIGQTLIRDKKYDEAARNLERLLAAKDERAVEAAHWLCQIAILRGRSAESIPIARDALQWSSKLVARKPNPGLEPIITLLRMDLADGLYSTSEGKAEARKLYEQIAVEAPESPICPRATYNAAFAALQAGEHSEAQRWSEAFAKRFPNDELALDISYVRAESLLQLSQFESAATAFEQLIRSADSHPSLGIWELRAINAKFMAGDYAGVETGVGAILQRTNEPIARAEALHLKGASFLKQEKSSEAIEAFEGSLQAAPKWAQADETLLLLALAYDGVQDKKKAKSTLERLLKEFPDSKLRTQAELRLGQISASIEDYPSALLWYDRVLTESVDPAVTDFVRYDKAFVLIQMDRFPEALAILQSVTNSTKNTSLLAECVIAKAICLRRTKKAAEAIAILEPLSTRELPSSAQSKILYELGLAYSDRKQNDRAILVLTDLVEKFPQYPLLERACFELAWAHKSGGNVAQAKTWFQRIIDEYPDSSLAAEAYFHVGQTEFENSRYESAIKAYTVAATKNADPKIMEQSLYKLGLSQFQQRDYLNASTQFQKQIKSFPNGPLSIDARLMLAECSFKLEQFATAWPQYEQARKSLEVLPDDSIISDQVRTLIYLHGAQTARELKKWNDVDRWVSRLLEELPESNYRMVAIYEQAFARQNLKRVDSAIELYEEVAETERNALGIRARFMIGEAYFADRNFAKAVAEFQKAMYGFGGPQASEDVKSWQARSAFEAGRCSELFIEDLTGERRRKAIDNAVKFYEYIVENHPNHEMAQQAQHRIEDLKR